MEITTIGLDLAKNVFQVHGVDASGKPVLRKAFRRGQLLTFFRGFPLALSAWRPADRLIIGRAS